MLHALFLLKRKNLQFKIKHLQTLSFLIFYWIPREKKIFVCTLETNVCFTYTTRNVLLFSIHCFCMSTALRSAFTTEARNSESISFFLWATYEHLFQSRMSEQVNENRVHRCLKLCPTYWTIFEIHLEKIHRHRGDSHSISIHIWLSS